jgi:hypothetical protein
MSLFPLFVTIFLLQIPLWRNPQQEGFPLLSGLWQSFFCTNSIFNLDRSTTITFKCFWILTHSSSNNDLVQKTFDSNPHDINELKNTLKKD